MIALATIAPPWTLTGGGALTGIYYGHRDTRDLDLFWHALDKLERLPEQVTRTLRDAGMEVSSTQVEPAFHQLLVSAGGERVVVDLVADPVPVIEAPVTAQLGSVRISVDAPAEIFANKLCALLGRNELRDLVDVRALLEHGLSLDAAVRGAANKDTGFSALTLAWTIRQLPLERLATAAGMSVPAAQALAAFRDELIAELTSLTAPSFGR